MMRELFRYSGSVLGLPFFLSLLLAGCGSSTPTTTTTATTTTATAQVATISLTTSGASVKSDGSSSVTLTATALDANNAVVSGATITFSASTGQLSSSSVVTDATGKAVTTFSAGTSGINRTATITASIGTSITSSIPIQITGSTLTLSTPATSVAAGNAISLSAVAKDAGGNTVSGQTLRFSVDASSTGSGTLSANSATTNSSGTASVNFTGSAVGTVNILVEWLDAAGSTTLSSTQSYTISAAGGAFQVTTPATSPFAVSIGTNQTVSVNVPATVTSIRYATTLGSWLANGLKVLTVARGGAATNSQTFVPGNSAGNANIQVDALDAAGVVITSARLVFSISSPATSANSISLQSNVSVLQPSTGTNQSTAILTATVRDANLNPVGGAPVLFELVNSSGTGESISPVVVTTSSTDPMGQAQSIFVAGTSTTQGALIKASVVGTAVTATTPITVGGTPGSIAIGTSSTITSINSNTSYQLPVSVLVTDSNGNAVSGAVVSLSVWPISYYKGSRNTACIAQYAVAAGFANEDVNENLILDAGEDIDGPGGILAGGTFFGTTDSILWPGSSTAGSVPQTVTTGVDGTATFNWVYLKQHADWVKVRIRAKTSVQGTESITSSSLILGHSTGDESPCVLPSSPFN